MRSCPLSPLTQNAYKSTRNKNARKPLKGTKDERENRAAYSIPSIPEMGASVTAVADSVGGQISLKSFAITSSMSGFVQALLSSSSVQYS